eukprot:COSAG04_NODE_1225_length_7684_cov_9.773955_7_plen_200_part_00
MYASPRWTSAASAAASPTTSGQLRRFSSRSSVAPARSATSPRSAGLEDKPRSSSAPSRPKNGSSSPPTPLPTRFTYTTAGVADHAEPAALAVVVAVAAGLGGRGPGVERAGAPEDAAGARRGVGGGLGLQQRRRVLRARRCHLRGEQRQVAVPREEPQQCAAVRRRRRSQPHCRRATSRLATAPHPTPGGALRRAKMSQ